MTQLSAEACCGPLGAGAEPDLRLLDPARGREAGLPGASFPEHLASWAPFFGPTALVEVCLWSSKPTTPDPSTERGPTQRDRPLLLPAGLGVGQRS